MSEDASNRQRRLAAVLRAAGDVVRATDVQTALGIERTHASQLLAAWHKQGVVRRVARGVYVPVSPESLDREQVLADPWVLVPELYKQGYVGGWSALEHWELTEQLFRSLCILSAARSRRGNVKVQGVNFYVKPVSEKTMFGIKSVWREGKRIPISDPHKTILDVINDVYIGGGVQHAIDCMREFKKLYGKPGDLEKLFDYAVQFENGSLIKKLGFLGAYLKFEESFVRACAERLSNGYAYLDKSSADNKLVTRWRLWVPRDIGNDY
ncbi:MAG: type IV toxin-antitoxin system AbiEi family antitoxin domain-containing protein [Pseudomonadales bacterium]|nr:type IV toxin-antitoxin system AbiEi family antitoxin domain-containing protein [Pseudomonadales bacterium]